MSSVAQQANDDLQVVFRCRFLAAPFGYDALKAGQFCSREASLSRNGVNLDIEESKCCRGTLDLGWLNSEPKSGGCANSKVESLLAIVAWSADRSSR